MINSLDLIGYIEMAVALVGVIGVFLYKFASNKRPVSFERIANQTAPRNQTISVEFSTLSTPEPRYKSADPATHYINHFVGVVR